MRDRKRMLFIVPLVIVAIMSVIFMWSDITGYVVLKSDTITLSDSSVYFENDGRYNGVEFIVRTDDALVNHASWQLGGFASDDSSPASSSDDRAVFYVDVGAMKAFVRNSEGIQWCSPMNVDLTNEYLFGIYVDHLSGMTRFYIDNVEVCSIGKVIEPMPVIFSENDVIGELNVFIKELKLKL